jgi:hypothetical protein
MPISLVVLRLTELETDIIRRALLQVIADNPAYYKDQAALVRRIEALQREARTIRAKLERPA